MSKVPVLTVKRHPEESARSGAFWERDHRHALASKEWKEHGEVWISDDDEHVVADTPAVRDAIKRARLIEVGPAEEPEYTEAEIQATDAARKLAEEAGLDLVEIPPTGAQGQVTKSDVEKAIQRAKDAKPAE